MKKAGAILLLVLFAYSSFGFTIYYHECPYKGTSVSFIAEKHCCCSNKGEMPKSCCKNHGKQIKIVDKYSLAETPVLKPVEPLLIPNFFIPAYTVFNKVNLKDAFNYSDHSPPEHCPLFLFDRSLLI